MISKPHQLLVLLQALLELVHLVFLEGELLLMFEDRALQFVGYCGALLDDGPKLLLLLDLSANFLFQRLVLFQDFV